jgi:hypothetical protein
MILIEYEHIYWTNHSTYCLFAEPSDQTYYLHFHICTSIMSLVRIVPLFIQRTDNSICFLNRVVHSLPLPSGNDPSEIFYTLMVKFLLSLVFSALLNNILTVALSAKFMRSGLRDHLFKPSIFSIFFPSTATFHFVHKFIVKYKFSIIINGGNKHSQKLVLQHTATPRKT